MSRLFFTVVCAAACTSLLSTAASTAAAAEGERVRTEGQDDTRRPVALTINPLAIIIQRYGANLEVSPLPHHAFVASGYVQSVPVTMLRPFAGDLEIRDRATAPSLGGEIGYRLYSGRRGAQGVFIGGSAVAMPVAYARLAQDATVELERLYGYGGAVDIGAQTVTSFGLTIGGGLGASFLAYDVPNDPRRIPLGMPGVLPRLLLQTGYSF